MALLKCKICGGSMEVAPDKSFGTCEYCGTSMTLPKVSDEQRAALFNRGNHFRRTGEFDKALAIYENIVREDDTDAEAHWCCALCRFGIEYVEDPNTYEFVPTCHRASFDSFLEDVDYLAALENSDGITHRQYQKDAAKIADVQKGILATSQNEEPFDVFICYKETDDTTKERTKDSIDAQEIYYQLTNEGYRVFFSRITLEDKVVTEYEPYIFAALNSAKVMVAIGSKSEYLNAVWVKNEWSRFLAMMRKDRNKLLLPCYKGMDPYDLPEQLSVLQSYDMAKIGFIQDLIRGIKKVIDKSETKTAVKETVVVSGSANIAPLLKRAFIFLEDGNWTEADEYCEKVLDQDPENAQAYIGKLMAELHVRKQEDLANCEKPFDSNNNYQKAVRFGDNKTKATLSDYINHINERNENNRLTGIYNEAVSAMNRANTESGFKAAAETFKTIHRIKDSEALAEKCLDKAEICRKDDIYSSAKSLMSRNTINDYETAITKFRTISGWKDADDKIYECQRKIEEIKAKEEADRLERKRQAERNRIAAEKAAKKRKKIIIITTTISTICIVFVVLLITVIIPDGKYNSAVELYDAGKYDEAITAFTQLSGYKDSEAQITKCETAINDNKYKSAVELYNAGKYDEAITAFAQLNGYKDSEAQITECEKAIKDSKYNAAVNLYNSEKYEEAIFAFTELNGYKDSAELITKIKDIKYNNALNLYNSGKFSEAFAEFSALNGYNNSEKLKTELELSQIKNASVGDVVYFGLYEQDGITSNGKEVIEWLVLEKKDNQALVISKYGLDRQDYNYMAEVTWETCSLRKWLNSSFMDTDFSAKEQNSILSSMVTADKNPENNIFPGNNTTDKVFLLSFTEANKYFHSDETRICVPTYYAEAQGVGISDEYEPNGNFSCWWWLRTPGKDLYQVMAVYLAGSFSYNGCYVNTDHGPAVRPAMWIDIGD